MKQSSIAVILPSYNESANIPVLLQKIFAVLPRANVCIVDDSEQAQWAVIQETVRTKFPAVTLIVRKIKSGRGSAVLAGLSRALCDTRITHFFEMDADLAHDPADFAKFLAKKDKADLVIGSRYMAQSVITDWPMVRIVASRLINVYLRLLLGLNLTDYTNGFRLYSRRAVRFLLTVHPRETGFIGLSETAYLIRHKGYPISEVPVTFTDRKYGKSSATVKELLESFLGSLRIKLIKYR